MIFNFFSKSRACAFQRTLPLVSKLNLPTDYSTALNAAGLKTLVSPVLE